MCIRDRVCNALEHVLVDREIAKAFLPLLKDALPGVKLKGDAEAAAILGVEEVGDDEFFVEYDDLILSAKVVGGIEEAIAHINTHSTKHSDVILTTDLRKADAFTRAVDSAAVYEMCIRDRSKALLQKPERLWPRRFRFPSLQPR